MASLAEMYRKALLEKAVRLRSRARLSVEQSIDTDWLPSLPTDIVCQVSPLDPKFLHFTNSSELIKKVKHVMQAQGWAIKYEVSDEEAANVAEYPRLMFKNGAHSLWFCFDAERQ